MNARKPCSIYNFIASKKPMSNCGAVFPTFW